MAEATHAELRPPVSVVVPAYNEEAGIQDTVRQICEAMEGSGFVYEVIVVDDCSTDSTCDRLRQLGHQKV